MVVVTLTAASLAAPQPAVAQPAARSKSLSDADKKKISEHYEKANRYYQVGKYPEAIAEFEAAFLIGADPVMIFNIAQSYRLNNQPEQAARFYRNYLRAAPEAANRAEVERKIAEMDRKAAESRASSVPAPVPTAPPATSPTLPPAGTEVSPGSPAPPPAGGPVSPPATATWPPASGGAPPVGMTTSAPTAEAPRSRLWPMVLTISGGVLVATSLVFAGVAGAKAKEVEERAQPRNRPFDADTKKLEDAGKAASGLAVLSGLLGLAAGGAGLYLWLRSPSAPEATEPVGATSIIYPLAAPGLVGAGAQVTF